MFKVFVTIFLIFGTVVGAGFASGNEIVVFFSRFGQTSYLYISLAGVLLFVLLYVFLRFGGNIADKIENNKLLNCLTLLISLVFSASMFAGIESLLEYFPLWIHATVMVFLIMVCIVITLRGIAGVEKFNLYLMPILMFLFFIVLCSCCLKSSDFDLPVSNSWIGIWYSPLYVALNTSMSIFVLAKKGQQLSKKQTLFASLFSTLLLICFLIFGNFVLLKNPESFVSEMPILYISKNNFAVFILEFIVVLIGCFSTLISLCFTLKISSEKIIKNNLFCVFLSVFLPYFVSSLGFSKIISFLYPICSVVGIFIVLFSVFFLNQTNNIIHSKSQDAQDGCGSHY